MVTSLVSPVLRFVGNGHSLFSFISDYWQAKAKKYGNDIAFHRLCSLMRKMCVTHVVIENIGIDDYELSKENNALTRYFNQEIAINTFRFTFISTSKELSISDIGKLSNDEFLASAVLVNFTDSEKKRHSYIQKAIVCIPRLGNKPLLNNYIHLHRDFNCSVNIGNDKTHDFTIHGTFFCQQNSVTSVCAHASLSMIITNMNLPKYDIFTTEDINEILGFDHKNIKLSKGAGLDEKQVSKVLKSIGLKMDSHDFIKDRNSNYADYIYKYIEGGCPALIVFTTNKIMHVITVIGHTLNSDIWRAEAELAYNKNSKYKYRSSFEWVDHLIIHDDNFGMYLCLSVDSLRNRLQDKNKSIPSLTPYITVAILPTEVSEYAQPAELAAESIVRDLLGILIKNKVKSAVWLKRLKSKRRPMLIRTLLVKKQDYRKHLSKNKDFDGSSFKKKEIQAIINFLPDYFWLLEITLPDLYTANKSKLVDFIYVCNKQHAVARRKDPNRWILIRFPEICLFNRKYKNRIQLAVKNHFPLYRSEKTLQTSEW